MSDRIFIKGLALHAYYGVMPHEAKVGQTFTIDLELEIDLSNAVRSDKVVDTVSYDKVVDCTTKARSETPSTLFETRCGSYSSSEVAGSSQPRSPENHSGIFAPAHAQSRGVSA